MEPTVRPTIYLVFNPSSLKYFTPYRETWTRYAEYAAEYHSYSSARTRANDLGRELETRLKVVEAEKIS